MTHFSKQESLIFKGTAIILMLVHHLFAFPDLYPVTVKPTLIILGKDIFYLLAHFGVICVSIFSFLSGYGLYCSWNSSKKNFYLKKQIINSYRMLWRVILVFFPLLYYFDKPSSWNIKNVLLSIVGLNSSIVSIWWFFTSYLIILLLSPIIFQLVEKQNIWILIVETAICSWLTNTFFPSTIDVSRNIIIENLWTAANRVLPGFIIGATAAKYDLYNYFDERITSQTKRRMLALILIPLIIILRLVRFSPFLESIEVLFLGLSIHWLNGMFPYIDQLFIHLGKESGYMWLIHPFFCWQLFPKIGYFPGQSLIITIWFAFLVYVIAYAVHHVFDWVEYKLNV